MDAPMRGEIYTVAAGRATPKASPAVVVSNNVFNAHTGLVTLVPITTQGLDNVYPAEVRLPVAATGLKRDGKAQADQIRTVSAGRLRKRIGTVPMSLLDDVERAIRVHLGVSERPLRQD